MDEAKGIARRLLKSRLRRHLVEALGSERSEESWPAVAEVEEGVYEEVWAVWVKARAAHTGDLSEIVHEALYEAAEDVRGTFEGMVSTSWLDDRIRSFVDTFQVCELLNEEG